MRTFLLEFVMCLSEKIHPVAENRRSHRIFEMTLLSKDTNKHLFNRKKYSHSDRTICTTAEIHSISDFNGVRYEPTITFNVCYVC